MAHKEQQQYINNELKEELRNDSQAFSQQLANQLAQIRAATQGQKAEFSAELKASQKETSRRSSSNKYASRCLRFGRGHPHLRRMEMPRNSPASEAEPDLLDGPELQNNNYRFCGKCMRQHSYVDDGSEARKSDFNCQFFTNSRRANSFSSFKHILCQWMWYHGIRVGEAKNPGPPGQMKVRGLNVQLHNSFLDDKRILSGGADILVCSETCATKFVEQKATKMLHSAGRHVAFGRAVDRRTFVDGRLCQTKSKAQGVAICSVCPLRPCHQSWSQEAWQTCRVTDTYVLAQGQQIRVFAVYGYHQGYDDIQIKSETLLRENPEPEPPRWTCQHWSSVTSTATFKHWLCGQICKLRVGKMLQSHSHNGMASRYYLLSRNRDWIIYCSTKRLPLLFVFFRFLSSRRLTTDRLMPPSIGQYYRSGGELSKCLWTWRSWNFLKKLGSMLLFHFNPRWHWMRHCRNLVHRRPGTNFAKPLRRLWTKPWWYTKESNCKPSSEAEVVASFSYSLLTMLRSSLPDMVSFHPQEMNPRFC